MSTEALTRAAYMPKLHASLEALPRKLVEIDGDEPKVAADEGGASSVAW